MTRSVEVCDVVVSGKVLSVGRSTGASSDATYVRFQGAAGQVTVLVPDGIPLGNATLRAGAVLTCQVDIEDRGKFVIFRAVAVSAGLMDGVPAVAASVVAGKA